jgi:hypothetical protein
MWPHGSLLIPRGRFPTATCHSGVPQGSVLSPHLLNFFLSDFPAPAQLNLSYADDIQLAESSPDVKTICPVLTNHLSKISQWSKDNKLGIAPEKSHITVGCPLSHNPLLHTSLRRPKRVILVISDLNRVVMIVEGTSAGCEVRCFSFCRLVRIKQNLRGLHRLV